MFSSPTLLNIQQVADYLQLNHSTVYQWAQQGRLAGYQAGRAVAFPAGRFGCLARNADAPSGGK